jgi:hypothetical protein
MSLPLFVGPSLYPFQLDTQQILLRKLCRPDPAASTRGTNIERVPVPDLCLACEVAATVSLFYPYLPHLRGSATSTGSLTPLSGSAVGTSLDWLTAQAGESGSNGRNCHFPHSAPHVPVVCRRSVLSDDQCGDRRWRKSWLLLNLYHFRRIRKVVEECDDCNPTGSELWVHLIPWACHRFLKGEYRWKHTSGEDGLR